MPIARVTHRLDAERVARLSHRFHERARRSAAKHGLRCNLTAAYI